MRVWQSGEGPAVVALHGLGGSGRYWNGLSRLNVGHTLVAPDLAGFGGSAKPRSAYDAEFHCRSLDRLIDHVSPDDPVTLVGHSVGGMLAALWAAGQPQRIHALALIATPFPGLHGLPSPVRWAHRDPYAVARRLPINIIRAALYPAMLPIAWSRGNTMESLIDFTRQSLPARIQTATNLITESSLRERLIGLGELPPSTRKLIFTGTGDRLATSHDVQAWNRLLADADNLVWKGGHQVLLNGGFAQLEAWLEHDDAPGSHRPDAGAADVTRGATHGP